MVAIELWLARFFLRVSPSTTPTDCESARVPSQVVAVSAASRPTECWYCIEVCGLPLYRLDGRPLVASSRRRLRVKKASGERSRSSISRSLQSSSAWRGSRCAEAVAEGKIRLHAYSLGQTDSDFGPPASSFSGESNSGRRLSEGLVPTLVAIASEAARRGFEAKRVTPLVGGPAAVLTGAVLVGGNLAIRAAESGIDQAGKTRLARPVARSVMSASARSTEPTHASTLVTLAEVLLACDLNTAVRQTLYLTMIEPDTAGDLPRLELDSSQMQSAAWYCFETLANTSGPGVAARQLRGLIENWELDPSQSAEMVDACVALDQRTALARNDYYAALVVGVSHIASTLNLDSTAEVVHYIPRRFGPVASLDSLSSVELGSRFETLNAESVRASLDVLPRLSVCLFGVRHSRRIKQVAKSFRRELGI